MSYKEFRKDYRSNMFHNVVMLTGRENYLIRWACSQLKTKYGGKDFQRENVLEIEGDRMSMDEIIGMAKTPSMFPGQRVLVVRNYPWICEKKGKSEMAHFQKEEGKRLLDYAAGTDHLSLIVLSVDAEHSEKLNAYGKKLMKSASAYTFDSLSRPELEGFIAKRVKKAGKTMTGKQLGKLIDLSGYFNKESLYGLDDMDNDIKKILYSTEGVEIQDDEIEDLMVGDEDKFVFSFMDALLAGDRKKAITMTEYTLAEGTGSSFQLIGLLTSQFEMMYDALIMEEKGLAMGAMVKALGVNEYRFKKAYRAAKKFTKEKLKELLILLYNADRDIKSGNMSDQLALEMFILHV